MIQFEKFDPKTRPHCVTCEDMIADAVDGTLNPTDQARFQAHLATCVRCAEMFTEAERGAGWLKLLKEEQPELQEYRTGLIREVLRQTTGQTTGAGGLLPQQPARPLINPARYSPAPPVAVHPAVFATPQRIGSQVPVWRTASRILFEPRLAMTAAMAFFSVALTLNLAGVHLNQLHARDVNPFVLRQDLYRANAGAVRYYDNLRVVHVLESRVEDLRDRIGEEDPGSSPENAPGTRQTVPQDRPVPRKIFPEREEKDKPSRTPGTSFITQPETRPHRMPVMARIESDPGGTV